MIPKIIHQIWIQGYNKIPQNLKKLHTNCQKINSDFKFIFWDEDKIKEFISTFYNTEYLNMYNSYTVMAQKADFARYLILNIYGGVYLDMDMICKKELNTFLKYKFFITTNDIIVRNIFSNRYPNGIIGTVPKHPLFKIIFKNLKKRIIKKNNITYSTGTNLLYDSIAEYKKNSTNDITIIEPKYLHPCPGYSDKNCPKRCKSCYVVHVNDLSWSPTLRYLSYLASYKYHILAVLIIIILLVLLRPTLSRFYS